MKYTLNEFASQIRNLYPNDYDDLTDEKLVELWLKKYPEDIEKIEYKIEVQQKKSKNIIEYLIEGIFALVVGGFLVLAVLYIKDPENVKNRLGLSKNTNSSNNQPFLEIPFVNDSKTKIKEYKNVDEVDKAFEAYGISKTDINILKNIYYDPNPDPENKVGLNCGTIAKNCKWCSNTFTIEQQFTSYKSTIELLVSPFGNFALIMGGMFDNNASIKNQIHQMCNNYVNGEKYACEVVSNASEFCSLKCANQFKYR
jgi:hypothetical protein